MWQKLSTRDSKPMEIGANLIFENDAVKCSNDAPFQQASSLLYLSQVLRPDIICNQFYIIVNLIKIHLSTIG